MRIRPGLSMLELVIAAGVIVTSVTATLTLIIATISAGRIGQSNIEAANYAREGIEIIRSIRDSNWLKGERNVFDCPSQPCGTGGTIQWDDLPGSSGYSSLGSAGGIYYAVDSLSASLTDGSWLLRVIGSPTPQRINDLGTGNYLAQQTACTSPCKPTRFFRLIKIIKDTECILLCTTSPVYVDRLKITSSVVWNERAGGSTLFTGYNHAIVAEEYLYKWR